MCVAVGRPCGRLNWRLSACALRLPVGKKQAVGTLRCGCCLVLWVMYPISLALQMACETGAEPLGVFKCQLCALTARTATRGSSPLTASLSVSTRVPAQESLPQSSLA